MQQRNNQAQIRRKALLKFQTRLNLNSKRGYDCKIRNTGKAQSLSYPRAKIQVQIQESINL